MISGETPVAAATTANTKTPRESAFPKQALVATFLCCHRSEALVHNIRHWARRDYPGRLTFWAQAIVAEYLFDCATATMAPRRRNGAEGAESQAIHQLGVRGRYVERESDGVSAWY